MPTAMLTRYSQINDMIKGIVGKVKELVQAVKKRF